MEESVEPPFFIAPKQAVPLTHPPLILPGFTAEGTLAGGKGICYNKKHLAFSLKESYVRRYSGAHF